MCSIYGLDIGIMMFEAVRLAAKDPDIVMNQEYIWGVFNMDFVAFNFSIEESISFKKKKQTTFAFGDGRGKHTDSRLSSLQSMLIFHSELRNGGFERLCTSTSAFHSRTLSLVEVEIQFCRYIELFDTFCMQSRETCCSMLTSSPL